MNYYYKLFNDYFKTFDIRNKKILSKFHHTYRVLEFARYLSESINLNEEDKFLVEISALFHDIARFKQMRDYNTYVDKDSFDHGLIGSEIVVDFIGNLDISDQKIIINVIKNHNKKIIDSSLTDREVVISKIIRDADKLDIMTEQGLMINDNCYIIESEYLDAINKKELLDNDYSKNDIGTIFRIISFIFDINYKYSFNYIYENIIDKKLNLLKSNIDDNRLDDIELKIKNYLKEMIEC